MIGPGNVAGGQGVRSLAVVILHYGDPGLTARIHDQLLQSDPKWADRVFALDNHAPELYARAWTRLDENLYWAGALAWAVDALAAQGFSHLWFLNNDIWFNCPAPIIQRAWGRLQRLDAVLGAPVGIWSPTALVNPYHPQMVADPKFQYRTLEIVDGIAPLFNLECLRQIGGVDLDGNPYGYGVDMVLSVMARRAGWSVVADHQVAVRHTYHSTAKQVDGFMQLAAKAEHSYLEARFGPEYKETLENLKRQFVDHDRL